MNQANRLITNTAATYGRMVLTVGIGLVTTRLVYTTLGEVDYGIFTVLGGGLSLIMILSTALAASAQRHLAFEIGRGDQQALREVFCTSVAIYLGLGLIIAGLGLGLRPVFLHGLTIPDDRQYAAAWVYDLSLFNLSVSVLVTPFLAVFIARQALVQDAIFGIVASTTGLLAILLTPWVHDDALIGYIILFIAAGLFLKALQIIRGLLLFPETRFRPRYLRKNRVRELVGFAGWSFLGAITWQGRIQGGNILINVFFGPAVNASYAIATQVIAYMNNFSGAITNAARPAIASIEGAGKRSQTQRLALTVSKLTVFGSCFVAIPLMFEPAVILSLWLGRVPPYADSFIPIMMAWVIGTQVVVGHLIALAATGKIGRVTRYTFWIGILPIPLGYCVFKFTSATPPYLSVCTLAITLILTCFHTNMIGRIVQIPVANWVVHVLKPISAVICFTVCINLLWEQLIGVSGLWTLGAFILINSASLALGVTRFGLNQEERLFFKGFISKIGSKLKS
ncbi:MAG: MATE family efflux transporter [Planctomycetota bacterium]